eukprot:TRINITY_DN1173_c0_g1_i1.p1 TRINITY_DN1173_c0_g1~~TRINITY_DN1173_c0_g1_i1.p1  ORF type:complete len:135 (+),score=20.78 TRINITY_DN1173_c0_g1_i1:87-491(+)
MLTRLLSVTARKNFKRPLARSLYLSSPSSQDSFTKREKGFEEQSVRRHEQDLIKKLQEELKKKDEQIKSEQQKQNHNHNQNQEFTSASHVSSTSEGHDIAHNDLLEFRREFLGRIRSLEDDISDIKYRLKKKGI